MSRIIRAALAALAILALSAPAALAHEGVQVGSYEFEIGWVNEPVVVGQPNGLDLFIAPQGTEDGVTGAEATLRFGVEYGAVSRAFDLVPLPDAPGRYHAAFTPTREGRYTFHFTGALSGEAVDVSFEPEEVQAAASQEFPEPQTSARDLADKLAAVQTIAIAGAVLGLIGAGLGAASLLRKM
jgi:hypothetical protein